MNYSRRAVLAGGGVVVSSAIAGCSSDGGGGDGSGGDGGAGSDGGDGSDGDGSTPTESLAIEHVRFVQSQPTGYRQYQEASDTTYGPGDVVWIYFEPVGLQTESADGNAVRIDLTTSLTVRSPDGGTATTQTDDFEQVLAPSQSDRVFLHWRIPVRDGATSGEYTAELGVTDQVSDRTVEEEATFTVEGTGSGFVDAFRSRIAGELDVEIRALEVSGETVQLTFATDYAIDSSDMEYAIGFVAGAYSSYVANGWSVEALVGTVVDGVGDRYRFRVTTDLALQFANDEISNQEFASRVFDTVESA